MTQSSLGLNDSLIKVRGIGPQTFLSLQKKGISTVNDALHFFPISYEFYERCQKINSLQLDDKVSIVATAKKFITSGYSRKSKTIQKLTVDDVSGQIEIIFFNQPFLKNSFQIGQTYAFSGKKILYQKRYVFVASEFELAATSPINTRKILANYSETAGQTSHFWRKKIPELLTILNRQKITETLPTELIKQESLVETKQLFNFLHQPKSKTEIEKAQYRLDIEQLWTLILNSERQRKTTQTQKAIALYKSEFKQKLTHIQSLFNFELTNAQKRCLDEILADLGKTVPMNRILVGDVGSGKTILFLLASCSAVLARKKTLILLPTTVLAQQHYAFFNKLLKKQKIKIGLLTNKNKLDSLKDYEIVVSTQAIFWQEIPPDVALVIIDEQHKFGVHQRQKLLKVNVDNQLVPHLLTVSATPIPRSLALILYGSLSVSFLDEMPKGRLPIKTALIPSSKRASCYHWLNKQITDFYRQVFVVCPLIENSSKSQKSLELKSVANEYQKMQSLFPKHKIEFLHSQVKNKEALLASFLNHEFPILITTTVVEVGVDIPDATIMLIEDADRFGLAQLHQLRGRIGRNNQQSYCFLFTNNYNPKVIKRLQIFCENHDGFKLAQLDLQLRGQGDLFGTAQHGFNLNNPKLLLNSDLIARLKKHAQQTVDFETISTYNDQSYNLN